MNKIFAAVFGLLFFIFSSISEAYAPEGQLFVTMLDVGQGDCFLIETAEQNVLIDTGDTSEADNLVAMLQDMGIERFERVILSHPHADHIGGLPTLAAVFPIDIISDNGITSASPLYLAYHQIDTNFEPLKSGDIVDLGGGVKFKVLAPSSSLVREVNSRSRRSYPNNESIVGKLIFGDFSILFTGDAQQELEDALFNTYPTELKSTILKAAHHGAKKSSTADFVHAVEPDFVFISAGVDNKYGHPHKDALKNFRYNLVLPTNIFCTRFNGSVRVESDGKNYYISVERDNDWLEEYTHERYTVTRID